MLDAGCGTGRALPALRAAVGPGGTVLGADLTPAMLDTAVRERRGRYAQLAVADVARLPLRKGSLDAVFAAGLLSHLPGPESGPREPGPGGAPRGAASPSSIPSAGPPSPRAEVTG